MSYSPRLKDKYTNEIVPVLTEKFKYKSVMEVPMVEKIVISQGVGEAVAGPTGASISNAIRRALGERITTMPFSQENIKKQLRWIEYKKP